MAVILNHLSKSCRLSLQSGLRISSFRYCHSKSHGKDSVRIACASGFWGDTPTAVPQLVYGAQNLDFLVFDYLSEVTMSLLTAAQAKNPDLGYAPDFVLYALAPYLKDIKNKGIRVVSNAGGINTSSCVAALKLASKKAGVELKIAEVKGENLFPMRDQLLSSGNIREMSSGRPLPKTVHSMTAYYGAGPIARALDMGADIVVTGRVADSALALGPCVHALGWDMNREMDKMAAGSLAGHLIECGGQATGGLFTDWQSVNGYENLGFPVVDVTKSGEIYLTKPPKTGGLVNEATVAEQLLYEIGDPRKYILPDVVCDFSNVKIKQVEKDVVKITGAKGCVPTDTYKVCATYLAGYKATAVAIVAGGNAAEKARKTADGIIKRSRAIFQKMGMKDFERTHVTVVGAEENFGVEYRRPTATSPRDVALWMAVQHQEKQPLDIWAREIASSGTGMAPGLCSLVGGRPKPSPCLKLFSFLYPKQDLPAQITLNEETQTYTAATFEPASGADEIGTSQPELQPHIREGPMSYTLEDLAYARSGDKGDSCNIGVIARHPSYLPYIRHYLTEANVGKYFAHMMDDGAVVHRYDVPGIHAVNFLLEKSLGGGGIASLRPDPLGKSYAQMLLSFPLNQMPRLEDIRDALN